MAASRFLDGGAAQQPPPPAATQRIGLLALAAWVCVVTSGCGNHGPRSCHIHGEVTIDGTPAREGVLRFEILTAGDLPSGAAIVNGHYDTWVAPGPKLVRLVVAGSRDGLSERDMAANIVPPKYEKDPPRIDVKKNGAFDFHLTTD